MIPSNLRMKWRLFLIRYPICQAHIWEMTNGVRERATTMPSLLSS